MRIVLDIETNLAHDKIWCCVTKNLDTGEVAVWKDSYGFGFDLADYLNHCETIIMHNGVSFDAPVLNRVWGTKIKLQQCVDTLLLSRLADPAREDGHSLDAWGKRLGFNKIEFDAYDAGLTEEMITYCIRDVELTEKLYHHLMQEITKLKITEQAIKIEHEVQAIIVEQERNGFKLDTPYAQTLLCTIKTEMSEIEEALQKIFPPIVTERVSEKTGKKLKDDVETFNVGSRQQIAKRLISKGWQPNKTTEKGQIIVDETTLESLDIPEAKPIARYLMLQKRAAQLNSWLDNLGKDGRVHGRVITMGAVTGRATHSSPNMAQVPAVRAPLGVEFRSCWTVDQGNVLVGCDLSGIELRCFAHYLNDQEYINEVVYGDVHTRNQKAFGVETRDLAKTVLYATLYGASPAKIATIVGASPKRGTQIINNFCKAVPAYDRLKSKVEKLSEKGTLPGIGGYQLKVRSAHSSLNTLLQSAGAIISKVWLIQIKKALKAEKIPYKQVAWVHDEVQIETPEQYGDRVGQLCVEAAKQAGEILQFRCPVGAEYGIAKNWAGSH
jgi:DNA polymerase I-like protein with 3'-5' exonuclease and polymerase domains